MDSKFRQLTFSIIYILYIHAHAAALTVYSIDASGMRNEVVKDAFVSTANLFECLYYTNPTRYVAEHDFFYWKILLDTKEEFKFSESYNDDSFIVSADGNIMQLAVLGGFHGSVSCNYDLQFVRFSVATERKLLFCLIMQ